MTSYIMYLLPLTFFLNMLLRFIQVWVYFPFFTAESCFLVWTDNFVKSSPVRRYLECFHFGEHMKNPLWTSIYVFVFCRHVFILLDIYPGVKLLVWVQFHWNNLTDLFSKARKSFYRSTSSMIHEASNCSNLCQHLVWSVSIIIITITIVISILVDVKEYSSTVMICISLLSNDDEYLLCFLAIYITFLIQPIVIRGWKLSFLQGWAL